MVLDAVDAVEGEGAEQRVAGHGLAHAGHRGSVLVAQEVAAQTGLGALGVLELHDAHPLDGLLAHAEEPGGHLGDHVVVVGPEAVVIAALAGAGEAVPGRRPRGPWRGWCGCSPSRSSCRRRTRGCRCAPAAGRRRSWLRSRLVSMSAASVGDAASTGGRQLVGTLAEDLGQFELEAQPVEPAARGAEPAFEMRRRGMPGGGLMPGGEDQIARPARIAHALGTGVGAQDEGLLRALGDAGLVALGALGADAEVVLRAQGERVAFGLDVHAVLADLHAVPAGLAAGQTVDLVLAEDVAVAIGGRLDSRAPPAPCGQSLLPAISAARRPAAAAGASAGVSGRIAVSVVMRAPQSEARGRDRRRPPSRCLP